MPQRHSERREQHLAEHGFTDEAFTVKCHFVQDNAPGYYYAQGL